MADIEFDNEEDVSTEPTGLIGEKVTSFARTKKVDNRHLTPFAVLAFFTFGLFIAIIVMQVLEIKFFQDGGMWPPQ